VFSLGYVGIHKKGELTISQLIDSIKAKDDFHKIGALASFVGIVRSTSLEGENVERLELEAYEKQANKVLGDICEDLKEREDIIDVQIHHFVGKFELGEDLIYVLVAGSHRQNLFGVLQEAVERYKHEAPVFKKEHIIKETGVKEAYWVNEKEVQQKRKSND
jgi:molybdopterin synthase catalytic subunit